MKHTPGKWEVSPYKAGLVGVDFDNPLKSVGICQVFGREPEADANIIAAAPKMYEALLISAQHIREWESIRELTLSEMVLLHIFDAAIAQAEGK